MRFGPRSSADMVDSLWGLAGSGRVTMRNEPVRPVFVGPGTTGRKTTARPWARA